MERNPLFDDRGSKRFVLIVLPVLVLMFYATSSMHFAYTPDDTYIYLQFAKNIIHGNGMSFNAGEPTYGFTSPLWVFIISLGGAVGVDVYIAAKTIDLVFASLTIVVFYFLSLEVIRENILALLSTLAFSLHVWLLRWAGSGMETSLSVLLVVTAMLFCLRNEYLISAVMAALLTLVRPEACLLLGLIAIDVLINTIDKKFALKMIARMTAVFALIVAPWLVYAFYTFGTVIPNTALAKSSLGFGLADVGHELLNVMKIVMASDGLSVLALLVGGIFLFRQFQNERSADNEERFFLIRQSLVGILWIVSIPLLYCMLHVHVVSRYLLVITPLITVFGFTYLFRTLNKSRYSRFSYAGVVVFTGLLLIQSQTVYYRVVKPGINAFAEGMESTLIPIGDWLKKNSAPGDVAMAWDIGAVGYYSNRKICDAAGLVTPEMISLAHATTFHQIIEERLYKSYCDVRYIVHRSDQPVEFKDTPGVSPIFTRPFYRLGIMRMDTLYYTLYKVDNDTSKSHLGSE